MVGRAPAHDRRDAPPRRYYVKDHLGLVRAVVDATCGVKEGRNNGPYILPCSISSAMGMPFGPRLHFVWMPRPDRTVGLTARAV